MHCPAVSLLRHVCFNVSSRCEWAGPTQSLLVIEIARYSPLGTSSALFTGSSNDALFVFHSKASQPNLHTYTKFLKIYAYKRYVWFDAK